jgi:hypothetical protein
MENGCSIKYISYADDVDALKCPKVEKARIWENNVGLLVQDQKDTYGCVN